MKDPARNATPLFCPSCPNRTSEIKTGILASHSGQESTHSVPSFLPSHEGADLSDCPGGNRLVQQRRLRFTIFRPSDSRKMFRFFMR